jgi:rhodanese-related sulfurtransferase
VIGTSQGPGDHDIGSRTDEPPLARGRPGPAALRARLRVQALTACAGCLLAAFASSSALGADTPAKQKPASKPVAQSVAKPTPGARPKTKAKQAQTNKNPTRPTQQAQPKQPATPAVAADCNVETLAETGPLTYTVPIPQPGTRKRVAECLVPTGRATALAAKGKLLLVDVRNASQFEHYRIPGSLNIPLSFVKTKEFLRQRPFALVNEGRSSAALEAACKELRAAGFKQAGVLRGGLAGWRSAKGAVEGDVLAQRGLLRMRPVELAEEGGYGDWIVLSVASVPAEEPALTSTRPLGFRPSSTGTVSTRYWSWMIR